MKIHLRHVLSFQYYFYSFICVSYYFLKRHPMKILTLFELYSELSFSSALSLELSLFILILNSWQ